MFITGKSVLSFSIQHAGYYFFVYKKARRVALPRDAAPDGSAVKKTLLAAEPPRLHCEAEPRNEGPGEIYAV